MWHVIGAADAKVGTRERSGRAVSTAASLTSIPATCSCPSSSPSQTILPPTLQPISRAFEAFVCSTRSTQ